MRPLVAVHLLGLVLGLGAATTADLVVVRALRRRSVGSSVVSVVERSARLVWVGVAMLMISGAGFVLTGSATTPRFWAKLVIVAVACANGRLVHRVVLPALRSGSTPVPSSGVLRRAGAAAGVSAVSWWGATVLGAWRSLSLGVPSLVAAYLVAAVGAAVVGSWVGPRLVGRSAPVTTLAPAERRSARATGVLARAA